MLPGLVELGVDIRGIKATTVDQVVEQVKQAADQVAEKRRLTVKISVVSRARPVQVSQRQIDRLIEACQTAGVEQIRLASRSAHDAMYLGQHGPISMLFVRNPAGISHNPAEEAQDEDIIAAGSVLATYLAWLAGQN